MKYPVYIFLFLFFSLSLGLPLKAQAQITITNSQARGGQSADAQRFTPSQMASQWGGAHQRQENRADQSANTDQRKGNQPAPSYEGNDTSSEGGNAPASQSALEGGTAITVPETPPHKGPNAVITITPSTALKSGSAYSQNPDEGEEKSITSWSSNATKAIIHYQEPTEAKPSTGAPQLRPLTE